MVMKDFDIHDYMLCIDTINVLFKASVMQKAWYRKLSIFCKQRILEILFIWYTSMRKQPITPTGLNQIRI